MMYIKRFVIKNFRVFDEEGIVLQFNKGVNAIIGENNSGKSAVYSGSVVKTKI